MTGFKHHIIISLQALTFNDHIYNLQPSFSPAKTQGSFIWNPNGYKYIHVTVKNTTLLFQIVRLVQKADCFCLAFYFKLRVEHSVGTFFMTHDLIAKGFFKFDSLTDS